MKYALKAALCAGIFTFGAVSAANAALVSTLGGLAVYDTDRDISWLADANAGAGSSFDNGSSTTDGRMTWDNANAWAASLNVGGVTGWRLPIADPICGASSNCTNSEMGHLFYNELGGTANSSILISGDPDLTLFSNVQAFPYWSGTEFAPNPSGAWDFNFFNGVQLPITKDNNLLAWAVHSGDVGATAVPEPGTIVLMGLGLAGLLGFSRRQR